MLAEPLVLGWTHLVTRAGVLRIVLGALALCAPAAATPGDLSAETFLRGIYQGYLSPSAREPDTSTPAKLRLYFDECLARAIERDYRLAREHNEVPVLDGDLFTDMQELLLSKMLVDVKATSPRTAMGTVTLISEDHPRRIVLYLVKTNVGWRIADMDTGQGLRSVELARVNGSARCSLDHSRHP